MGVEFKEFVYLLKDVLSRRLTDLEIGVNEVPTNNGGVCLGLVFEQKNSQSFVIKMDTLYREYQRGEGLNLICDNISRMIRSHLTRIWSQFNDLDKISDRIFLRLVNAYKNEGFLQNRPHRLYHDLAVLYYIHIEDEVCGLSAVAITNNFLSIWNVSEKDIYELAIKNSQEYLKSEINSIEDLRKEIMGDSYVCSADILGTEENPLESMYVVSNSMRWFGAAVILYDKVLEEIAGMLQNDFYILPSSVHDLFVVPVTVDKSPEELIQMVREINEREAEENMVLSNNIYLYHIEDKSVEMIGCDN